jgi:hypothetical protein
VPVVILSGIGGVPPWSGVRSSHGCLTTADV